MITGLLKIVDQLDQVVIESMRYLNLGEFSTVEDALGFLQFLLDNIGDFGINLIETYETVKTTITELVNSIPQISGGTFGIFKGKNDTKAGSYYQINTGKYEKHNFMELQMVNGREKLPDDWWPDVAPTPSGQDSGLKGICREIYGTDGGQFPAFVDKNERIWVYVGELCRFVTL